MSFVLTTDTIVVDRAGRRHVIKAGTTVTPVDRPAMPLDQ